jgi:hypothetical protein
VFLHSISMLSEHIMFPEKFYIPGHQSGILGFQQSPYYLSVSGALTSPESDGAGLRAPATAPASSFARFTECSAFVFYRIAPQPPWGPR